MALVWDRDGVDWPHREASRFIEAGGLRWHLQQMGQGPTALLLHGTGASGHSWRGLAPLLADAYTIVAPDLPGHGFTGRSSGTRLSLGGMSRAVAELLTVLGERPSLIIGHSAGAAIALRLALDGAASPSRIVSLCGSLLPFGGVRAVTYPLLAKALFLNPFAAPFLSRLAAQPDAVERVIKGTGSHLDAEGFELYQRLLRDRDHIAGVTAMMANWDLRPLQRDLPRLETPLTLVVAKDDAAVPPYVAYRVKSMVKSAEIVTLSRLGHLAHEEAPEKIAELIQGLDS
ncbi:MAG: alpha/beta fold hydrolase BchO [Pseudomonadota bacterium]